jgi:hypothetical protein
MKECVLIGRQEHIIEADAEQWRRQVAHSHHDSSTVFGFMTRDHHRVRNFVVSELPRNDGKPLRTQTISERLFLPLAQVIAMLDDLQRHLFFLVLNPASEVSWAFPVTSEPTPHQLRFSSGERTHAA